MIDTRSTVANSSNTYFHQMILQTDLSAREVDIASTKPPSDEENLQYDSSLMLQKNILYMRKYEQFKAETILQNILLTCWPPASR